MKRYVVGTLLFSIVMFVQLFGNIPVFADTFVPTSSYDFIGLSDLGYALVGGAEFDFTDSTYVIDNYNGLSAEQKEIQKSLKAREFLKDYCEARGIAFEEDGTLHAGPAYYTTAFGLAGLEFFEAFQTASSAEQEDLEYNMPISPSRFADWAQYNKYWFKRYAADFDLDNSIIVNPDPEYISLLDTINGSGFYFKDWENNYFQGNIYYQYYPLSSYSFRSIVNSFGDGINNYGTVAQLSDIITCNIISDLNGNYSCYVEYTMLGNAFAYSRTQRSMYGRIGPNLTWIAGNQGVGSNDTTGYVDIPSSSLYNVLSTIASYFRNVNIYVDGEAWSIVSNPAPANPTIPDFPDIINQDSGELAYNITMPKTQDYSGSFDLTSLFDAIREGIAGASDDDLATGSTIGSLDVGRTYTGEGIDINDRVIDLTSSRVFDGTLTDDTTGRLPKPPVVPPAVSAGLGGVTVLAKYVDATQCILPEDLMTAFWGCVWILIMLGLIKNLHR